MVCVIFVAGHNDLLESEIASDVSGRFDKLKGVPKALLPAAAPNVGSDEPWAAGSGSTILGRWWNLVNTRQILEVFLVTNANKFKYYERWATANQPRPPTLILTHPSPSPAPTHHLHPPPSP